MSVDGTHHHSPYEFSEEGIRRVEPDLELASPDLPMQDSSVETSDARSRRGKYRNSPYASKVIDEGQKHHQAHA